MAHKTLVGGTAYEIIGGQALIDASMITGLATVATSGNYNDLSNKPTVTTVAIKSWTSADI